MDSHKLSSLSMLSSGSCCWWPRLWRGFAEQLAGLKTAGVNTAPPPALATDELSSQTSDTDFLLGAGGAFCEPADAHQLVKSRCFCNEENHNGRSCLERPLAVMAALEGTCEGNGGGGGGGGGVLL